MVYLKPRPQFVILLECRSLKSRNQAWPVGRDKVYPDFDSSVFTHIGNVIRTIHKILISGLNPTLSLNLVQLINS